MSSYGELRGVYERAHNSTLQEPEKTVRLPVQGVLVGQPGVWGVAKPV